MRIVSAIPAVGLLAGCAVGLVWPDASSIGVVCVLIAAIVVSGWALRANHAWGLSAGVAVGFAAGGALLAADAWRAAWRPTLRVAFEAMAHDERVATARAGRSQPEDRTASATVVGVLRTDAALTAAGGVSLNIAVRWIGRGGPSAGRVDAAVNPVDGDVLLTVVGSMAAGRIGEWRAGRTIRAPAHLRRVSRYLDPGVPDHERALARRGVTLVGTIKSGALVETLSHGHAVAEVAARIRAFARRAIGAAVGRWSARSAGIVTAIVIGDRSGLDDDVERRLQEAGTYHVIAISGGNIAILAGLTLAVFRVAGLLGRGAMLSAAAGLVSYGYLVGGVASVDRATLMAALYFLGRTVDLRGPPLNSLALVAGILALGDPLAVADPAFLLTFGATAAILVAMPLVPVRRLPKTLSPFVALLVASAAAEAVLMPVGAALFSRVTAAGLILNFAAVPLMAVAQIAGMTVLALSLLYPSLAVVAGWIAHAGAEGLVRSADLVELMPALAWRVAPPGPVATTAYYAGLVTAWALWRRRVATTGSRESAVVRAVRRGAGGLAVVSAIWILAEPWTVLSSRGDGRLHVTFIDVGQGDSIFVRFPQGATLAIDAGGLTGPSSFDVGDRVVAPVLRAAGVRRLGTIALTHGDADHIRGAPSVVREFRPWEIWEGIPVPPFEPLQMVRADARRRGIRWVNVQTNDLVSIDDVALIVRHPEPPDWERQDVRNDDSIVLELVWRDVSFVLTGDIGREVEATIASRFPPSPLRVVKVPHHGSLTSSSEPFVRALAPRVAVVSVGRSNVFGHPAPAVLERYGNVGAAIFRTDRDGAVTVDTDGTSLDIHTFTGRRLRVTGQRTKDQGPRTDQDPRTDEVRRTKDTGP